MNAGRRSGSDSDAAPGVKLLVDIGNSRIKWVFINGGQYSGSGVTAHQAPELFLELFRGALRPAEIRVANVAGSASGAAVISALAQHFGVVPSVACSARSGAGVRNGYTDASQLGIDRWLALCGAFARYHCALLMVDAGTATTVDVVTSKGEHGGGLIVPGLEMMMSSLQKGTADIAELSSSAMPSNCASSPSAGEITFGRNTNAAIRLGTLHATVSVIRACLAASGGVNEEQAVQESTDPLLVLTGGAAPALMGALQSATQSLGEPASAIRLRHHPQLVLEGLALDPPCFQVAART